uniref:Uncharacterized protein n=1 Tax=uncultured prokaryote TaxID=198431 RepID=A0A0H5PZA9_9ZZZZ|nr:hypothetical protein [uncultured prokaryote]
MKKFAVEVHGIGFPIEADDGAKIDGFVVNVFVEAESEDDACDIALRSLVESEKFQNDIGCHADPDRAEVFVEQWFELSSFEGCPMPHSGFIFFQSDAGLH